MQQQTMAPTMNPNNAHRDIPGNPSTAKSSAVKLNDRSNGIPLRVLSEEDWQFWIQNGYIVIKNAIPREQALATASFLWEFEEKDPNNKDTWYTEPCIPELFRTYDTWKLTQPEDRNRFLPDTTGFTPTKVKLEAGDLLIFNSLEPHGIRANNSEDKVRIAQYISMMPAEEDNLPLKEWRINSWKNRIAPEGYAFPGDPRNWEQTKYETAVLSELGKKLLGLEKW
ncbi:MAG: hypothetical protein EBU80_03410 [Chitinophagia bacterium]|nr:hypothetical protein [Chitinophagia bacterium]